MTETICAQCGDTETDHCREDLYGHEFTTVDEYLQRVPDAYAELVPHALALAMPDAGKMEYLEADLEKAAKLMWIPCEATEPNAQIPPAEPSEQFIAAEIRAMRGMLLAGGLSTRVQPLRSEYWRWRILTLLNIPLKYYASSASRERGQ